MHEFTANEVIDIGKNIEKNGQHFYTICTTRTKDIASKKIFRVLAEQEKEHFKTFEEMGEQIKSKEIKLNVPVNQTKYLKTVSEESLFTSQYLKEMSIYQTFESLEDILHFAVESEEKSIHFYKTISRFLSWRDRSTIKKIVREEKDHIAQLEKMQAKYLSKAG